MGLFSKPTPQETWDDQIKLNRTRVLDVFRNRTAEQIADRMEECPNNPRHGGDGGVTDRRGRAT